MRERVGHEVGPELTVHDVQHVAVELGRDARRVVVGGDQAVGILHEVGAEEERVARGEAGGERGEEHRGARRARDCRSCCRGTRRRDDRRPAACRGGARSRPPPRGPRCPRTRARSRPLTRAASSRSRRTARSGGACLPWRARRAALGSSPRSRTRARRACRRGVRVAIVARALEEDGPLGARRVVLGEAGDLVEQLAAPVVVEPLRRQPLRRGREAGPDVGFEGPRSPHRVRGARRPGHRSWRYAHDWARCAHAATSTTPPSATSRHAGSSSSGSDATVEPRTNSDCPERVAAIERAVGEQQVEPPGRDVEHVAHDAARARRRAPRPRRAGRASARTAPRSRCRPRSRRAGAGLTCARSARPTPSWKPCTMPLSEKSHGPEQNGALPVASIAAPGRREACGGEERADLDVRRRSSRTPRPPRWA